VDSDRIHVVIRLLKKVGRGFCYIGGMNEPRENEPRRSIFAVWKWRCWVWFVVLPLMSLAYPLSLGPAMWFAHRTNSPQWLFSFLFATYRPLVRAVETFEPAEKILWEYEKWWIESALIQNEREARRIGPRSE
jgi:hypothetical protein